MQSLPILHQPSPLFLIGKEQASPEYPIDILFKKNKYAKNNLHLIFNILFLINQLAKSIYLFLLKIKKSVRGFI